MTRTAMTNIVINSLTWILTILGLFLILSAFGCARVPLSTRTSKSILGMPARQCIPEFGRQVICDGSLTDRDCQAAHDAVDYINYANSYTFYKWVGRRPFASVTADNLILRAAADIHNSDLSLETEVGMTTSLVWNKSSDCIQQVWTEVHIYGRNCSDASLETFFRHELAHGLGLPHQAGTGHGLLSTGFPTTLMDPIPFSESEINLLRAAYPETMSPIGMSAPRSDFGDF